MKQYVVLFRGINVGGHNKLPMKPLVAVLEAAGFSNVAYYIQTGNVVLDAEDDPASAVKTLVEKYFELTPQVMVLTAEEFIHISHVNPYANEEGKLVHCYICGEKPTLNIDKVNKYQSSSEQYTLSDRTLYLYAPEGIGRSKFVSNMESCLGVAATGRNLNTMNKILNLLD
jgi:uncharacterized protein (DUF1697 family)